MNCLKITINTSMSAGKQDLVKQAFASRCSKVYSEVVNQDIEDKLCAVVNAWIADVEKSANNAALVLTDMSTV